MNMKKGFTLIEIMIVVAIIAILAAIAIPNFIQYRKTSQENACAANIKVLNSATEAWRVKENKANDAKPEKTDLYKDGGSGYVKTWPTCGVKTGDYTWDTSSNSWVHAHN